MSNDKASILGLIKTTLSDMGQLVRKEQFEAHLDHAIRTTDEKLQRSKQERDAAKATRLHAQRRALDEKAEQKTLEAKAVVCLQSKQKSKARTMSFEISQLIQSRAQWEDIQAAAQSDERAKIVVVDMLEAHLRRLKHQLGVFRAAANLQRTQEALSNFPRASHPLDPDHADLKDQKNRLESPQDVMTRLEALATSKSTPSSKALAKSPVKPRKARKAAPSTRTSK